MARAGVGRSFVPLVVFLLLSGCVMGPREPAGASIGERSAPTPTAAVEPQGPDAGWVEFHPDWTVGGRFTWRNQTYVAAEDEEWATDGERYFYGRKVGDARHHAACVEAEPPSGGAGWGYVFVMRLDDRCVWAEHPGMSCVGASFCPKHVPPYGPPPTPHG